MPFAKKKIVSAIAIALSLTCTELYTNMAFAADPYFATTADATTAATSLGYTKTSELSNGQAVYKKGTYYITRDIDGHIGGAWKRAIGSAANLASKTTRDGTFNADLTKRIGD